MRKWILGLLVSLVAFPVYGQVTITGMTLADVTITAVDAGVDACDDVANLVTWLDATTGVSEGATFTWADQSGNGNDVTQTTANLQPAVVTTCQNSLDCIAFDADTSEIDYLSGSTWGIDINTTGIMVFIVFDALTTNTADFMLGQADGTGQGRNWVDIKSSPLALSTWFGGGEHEGTTVVSDDTTYIGVVALGSGAGAAADVYLNGSSDENAETDQGETSNGDMIVGSARDGTTSHTHRIMEICVYDTVLSTEDRESVRDALNTKWSVY